MKHSNGGKICGSHTTLIDLASRVVGIVTAMDCVHSVRIGYIAQGNGAAGASVHKVKLGIDGSQILLSVKQSRSKQDLAVFSPDLQGTMLAISKALRNNRIEIHFNGPEAHLRKGRRKMRGKLAKSRSKQ